MSVRLCWSHFQLASRRAVRWCSSGNGAGDGGEDVVIKGWIKRLRFYRSITFVDVADGLSPKHTQVVAQASNLVKRKDGSQPALNPLMSVEVHGKIVDSLGPGQKTEMQASSLQVHDNSFDVEAVPLPLQVLDHDLGLESTRKLPHLRFKDYRFAAVMRLRHHVRRAMQKFFDDRQFIYVDTPVLSTNDCEGAGKVFEVTAADDNKASSCSDDSGSAGGYFPQKTYLTVSGQLQLEAAAGGIAKAYTLGPAFRADGDEGRRHLSEFHMLEAEMAFTNSIEDITMLLEDLYCAVVRDVLSNHSSELESINTPGTKEHMEHLHRSVEKPFIHMTFHEALDILKNSGELFQCPITAGTRNLKAEHEKFLTQHTGGVPVFVRDFLARDKPFYARANDDEKRTAASCDLLVRGVLELAGGTLREERYDVLQQRLSSLGLEDEFKWYLELRRIGSTPHGGFGVGFDRFISYLTNVPSLRDVTPFPRFQGRFTV